jgi:hypothetical protein
VYRSRALPGTPPRGALEETLLPFHGHELLYLCNYRRVAFFSSMMEIATLLDT